MKTKNILFPFIVLIAFSGDFALAQTTNSSDFYYEYQLALLDKSTPIPLTYNEDVKQYIELFTGSRKDDMAKILGMSDIYFPLFDAYLDQYQLPLELKFLTVIESGLNPFARSKSAAVGLWQFKINTARMFNLQVESYFDERYDPYASTDAACRYLNYLYNTFNDWLLVLAAYNGGPGEVRKAIERAGGESNYWRIRPYLSQQARDYVPAFIAAVYVFNQAEYHQIDKIQAIDKYTKTDTLHINYAISFQQICDAISIPDSDLIYLNPAYKLRYIPGNANNILVLPTDKVFEFLQKENQIRAKINSKETYNDLLANAGSTKGKTKLVHVVQKGEYFNKIAVNYNCTAENIKAWNGLSSNHLYPGQKLIIWVEKKASDERMLYTD